MRMRAVALLLLLSSCSAQELTTARSDDCDPASSLSLSVLPERVARGDASVSLYVEWMLDSQAGGPVTATFTSEDETVEMRLQLLPDFTDSFTYAGSCVNPYGIGAPAGYINVLTAIEAPARCGAQPTAASSFVLE